MFGVFIATLVTLMVYVGKQRDSGVVIMSEDAADLSDNNNNGAAEDQTDGRQLRKTSFRNTWPGRYRYLVEIVEFQPPLLHIKMLRIAS